MTESADSGDTRPRLQLYATVAEMAEGTAMVSAGASLQPNVQAAATLIGWNVCGPQDLNCLVTQLARQAQAVNDGSLSRPEAMLTTQIHVLDAMFNDLARRARKNIAYPDAFERYMRMAFKAQSLCRTSVEALAEIKNPRSIAFVKQANFARGHQQVNNGRPRARKKNREPENKLLEPMHGERLERRTKGAGRNTHPALATVVPIDRPQNERRKKAGEPQQHEARGVQS